MREHALNETGYRGFLTDDTPRVSNNSYRITFFLTLIIPYPFQCVMNLRLPAVSIMPLGFRYDPYLPETRK